MKFEELLDLVREVGKAGLSDFEYREGNLFIKMSAAKRDSNPVRIEWHNNLFEYGLKNINDSKNFLIGY
jgi:hypothetical protein